METETATKIDVEKPEEESGIQITLEKYRERFPIQGDIVRFNVGGKRFDTFIQPIFSRHPSSLLASLIRNRSALRDRKGALFIDRNPALFPQILDAIRTGRVPGSPSKALKAELEYYQISSDASLQSRWTLDMNHKASVLNLSEDHMTVTHGGPNGHASIFGDTPLETGIQRWNVEIHINGDHWIALGVRKHDGSDFVADYDDAHAQSSQNQRFPTSKAITSSDNCFYHDGDVIECKLDCSTGKFTLRNRTDGHVEVRTDVACPVYPWINLHNAGNSARIFFEQ